MLNVEEFMKGVQGAMNEAGYDVEVHHGPRDRQGFGWKRRYILTVTRHNTHHLLYLYFDNSLLSLEFNLESEIQILLSMTGPVRSWPPPDMPIHVAKWFISWIENWISYSGNYAGCSIKDIISHFYQGAQTKEELLSFIVKVIRSHKEIVHLEQAKAAAKRLRIPARNIQRLQKGVQAARALAE